MSKSALSYVVKEALSTFHQSLRTSGKVVGEVLKCNEMLPAIEIVSKCVAEASNCAIVGMKTTYVHVKSLEVDQAALA